MTHKATLRKHVEAILFYGAETKYEADQFAHLCEGVASLLNGQPGKLTPTVRDSELSEVDKELVFEIVQDLFLEKKLYFPLRALTAGSRNFYFRVRKPT